MKNAEVRYAMKWRRTLFSLVCLITLPGTTILNPLCKIRDTSIVHFRAMFQESEI
jgi:hypothetical protein